MVKSVKDFLTQIETIGNRTNVFYRGHSNEEFDLLPGIYRKINNDKSLIQFEDKIFRDVVSKSPLEFQGKNTLESLVILQHYGSPTRILDLTENALVALYFACDGELNKHGEVIVFDIPDNNVCNYDSDKITILSNIAKCDKNFHYLGTDFIQKKIDLIKTKQNVIEFNNLKIIAINFYFDDNDKINLEKFYNANIINEVDLELINLKLDKFIEEYSLLKNVDLNDDSIYFKNSLLNEFEELLYKDKAQIIIKRNETFFGKLIHYIREDKSYFEPIIDPDDLDDVYAVKPKLDNPRIIRQQGAFLIFGIKETDKFPIGDTKIISNIDDKWIIKGKEGNKNDRIIIDKNFKRKILEELSILGINKATLFPEIDKVTDWVKNKYQEKINEL